MASRRDWVLGAAVVAMGLVAGLFYGFAVGVRPGLANADDRTLIDTMQQIDEAIENPVFFLTFLGAPVLAWVAWNIVRTLVHTGLLRPGGGVGGGTQT